MKLRSLLIICFVLMSASSMPGQTAAAAADPITGTWKGYMGPGANPQYAITMDLKLDKAAISGTFQGLPSPGEVKNGTNWVTKAADMVPAEKYTYRPADTVRTFGQLIGHIADIKYIRDKTEKLFQKLIGANAIGAVEALLQERPALALDQTAFWSEGVLMMPARNAQQTMLELLIRYGARVPDMSKWARAYYFRHYEIAVFLMEHGMNPNHRNCHRTTLLHDMSQEGNIQKARLLIDHGADLNAIDHEFRSTPLGLAARWGQRGMVAFLLERGADPNKSGAQWSTPLAWTRKKGHSNIEADLRQAGASSDL